MARNERRPTHLSTPKQKVRTIVTIVTERPRGIEPPRLACKPGASRNVLRDLRADSVRHHAPADLIPLPLMRTVPLAAVVLDDIDTVVADLAALHAAHPGAGNALLDRPGALDALAEIRMLLAEVA